MSYAVTEKKTLTKNVYEITVAAPRVARKHEPGQFVLLRVHEKGERIPLTVADKDPKKGTITLIFQVVGKTTQLLSELKVGDVILDVAGPLGNPTHLERFGTVICVSGGVGTAAIYPMAKALKAMGNHVVSILGAQSQTLLILESEMQKASNELLITTDDGSKGEKGFVTGALKKILERSEKPGCVIAIGPLPMMRAVAELTRPLNIKTIASFNTIMIDGTGMCGGCRVNVKGKAQFTCVDGPEFNAHEVDFDAVAKRLKAYCEQEKCSLDRYLQGQKKS